MILISSLSNLTSQNVLLNGDFEVISDSTRKKSIYNYNFYFKDWHEPTDCSSDIFRDAKICDKKHKMSIEPMLNYCIDVQSGNYCAGIVLMSFTGETEYLTGRFLSPLIKDSIYKISFWVKYAPNPKCMASSGLGYKVSSDSIVFKSKIKAIEGLSSNYLDLFGSIKIRPDFHIDSLVTNTKWTKITSLFKAIGGERFITFGMFSMENDFQFIQYLNQLKLGYNASKVNKFISKKTIFKRVEVDSQDINNNLDENYYYLDNISVEPLSIHEFQRANKTCLNCIDNDPMTLNIPNQLNFFVDKGFFGDLELSIHAILKPKEILKIKLDKENEILLKNESNIIKHVDYKFNYPASKVRNKSIIYSIINSTKYNDIEKLFKFNYSLNGTQDIHIFTNIKNIKQ